VFRTNWADPQLARIFPRHEYGALAARWRVTSRPADAVETPVRLRGVPLGPPPRSVSSGAERSSRGERGTSEPDCGAGPIIVGACDWINRSVDECPSLYCSLRSLWLHQRAFRHSFGVATAALMLGLASATRVHAIMAGGETALPADSPADRLDPLGATFGGSSGFLMASPRAFSYRLLLG